MIDAILLTGGLGTRLAQTVPHLPKALAPIQGTPFLQLLFEQLHASGLISKIILALGYKASAIQSYCQSLPYPIEFSIETTPLGTGGAILHALSKTTSSTLLVMNGDSFFDLSLSSFLAFHREQQSDFTIACREVEDASRYGAVEFDSRQRIVSFSEKSQSVKPGWINAGLYLIEKRVLSPFPHSSLSLEKEIFPCLLTKKLFAYPHSGVFIDIGTQNSYFEAQEILNPWI